jgi:hypothetical protein
LIVGSVPEPVSEIGPVIFSADQGIVGFDYLAGAGGAITAVAPICMLQPHVCVAVGGIAIGVGVGALISVAIENLPEVIDAITSSEHTKGARERVHEGGIRKGGLVREETAEVNGPMRGEELRENARRAGRALGLHLGCRDHDI